MIRHIVTWRFREGFTQEENAANAQKVKAELEALAFVIPGIVFLRVMSDALPTGNRDVMLDSIFESAAALAAYQVHPAHVRVSAYVGTVLRDRACFDCVEEVSCAPINSVL